MDNLFFAYPNLGRSNFYREVTKTEFFPFKVFYVLEKQRHAMLYHPFQFQTFLLNFDCLEKIGWNPANTDLLEKQRNMKSKTPWTIQ